MSSKPILVVQPPKELFEPISVAANEALGPWPAVRCKACGWTVTVNEPTRIPPHECTGVYESEGQTSTKRKNTGIQDYIKKQALKAQGKK